MHVLYMFATDITVICKMQKYIILTEENRALWLNYDKLSINFIHIIFLL